jgi:mRNA-degrading endonuclease RelE of RelBE toxin-antitoxin system
MAWRLIYSRRAINDMDSLPDRDRRAMHDRLGQLASDPRLVDLAKLAGAANRWRLRSGHWRAILEMDAHSGLITIIRVLNRRDAYR